MARQCHGNLRSRLSLPPSLITQWSLRYIKCIVSVFSCDLLSTMDVPTIVYEANVVCTAQIKGWYIKRDRTKHISPKFFYNHKLQQDKKIDVKQICSTNSFDDLFTKALPTSIFEKLVYSIGMRRLKKLNWFLVSATKLDKCALYYFFFDQILFLWILLTRF